MEIYCYVLILMVSVLLGSCVKLKVETHQELDLGNHFKPKKHFLFEHCAKCGKPLKHYHWFWGKGDFMGCEVDYKGNTEWFCEVCENEFQDNVLQQIPIDHPTEKGGAE